MALADELHLDQPFEDKRHEALLNIVRTANLLAASGAKLFRKFGLTEAQFNVLFVLANKNGAITQSEIGDRLVVTRASITSVLDKLEAKKLVARKDVPGNRRINHVEITAAGRRLFEEVEPRYRETIHRATAALSNKDCVLLIGHLERLRDGVAREHV